MGGGSKRPAGDGSTPGPAKKFNSGRGMATIEKTIKLCLPSLEPEKISTLMLRLQEVGATSVKDLEFTAAEDIADIVKPIHARKLMKFWAEYKEEDDDSAEPDEEEDCEVVPQMPVKTEAAALPSARPTDPISKGQPRVTSPSDRVSEPAFAGDSRDETLGEGPILKDFNNLSVRQYVGVRLSSERTSRGGDLPAAGAVVVVPKSWIKSIIDGSVTLLWPITESQENEASGGTWHPRSATLLYTSDSFEDTTRNTFLHKPCLERTGACAPELTGLGDVLASLRGLSADVAAARHSCGALALKMAPLADAVQLLTSLQKDMSELPLLRRQLTQLSQDRSSVSSQLESILSELQSCRPHVRAAAVSALAAVPEPAETLEQLSELLRCGGLTSVLQGLGGSNINATMRNLIRRLMRRCLAIKFSYSGLGEKRAACKIPFKNHEAARVVIDAATTLHPEASREDILASIRRVLKSAVDWEGARNKRRVELQRLEPDGSPSQMGQDGTPASFQPGGCEGASHMVGPSHLLHQLPFDSQSPYAKEDLPPHLLAAPQDPSWEEVTSSLQLSIKEEQFDTPYAPDTGPQPPHLPPDASSNPSFPPDDRVLLELHQLQLSEYASKFTDAHIDYASFLLLTADLLKDVGVDKVGPRAKLLHRIHKLKLAAAAPPLSSESNSKSTE